MGLYRPISISDCPSLFKFMAKDIFDVFICYLEKSKDNFWIVVAAISDTSSVPKSMIFSILTKKDTCFYGQNFLKIEKKLIWQIQDYGIVYYLQAVVELKNSFKIVHTMNFGSKIV